MLKRLLPAVLIGALAALAWHALTPVPTVEAVGTAEILGEYRLKLRGNGFKREAVSGQVVQSAIKGGAAMVIALTEDVNEPRVVDVTILLESRLNSTPLGVSTQSPVEFHGRGILIKDSLTAISVGQPGWVNAVTLRFSKGGKKVAGWWITSWPGSKREDGAIQAADADRGFVAGSGVLIRGKRLRLKSVDPVTPAAQSLDALLVR